MVPSSTTGYVVSDQGALGECSHGINCAECAYFTTVEIIMTNHHYTNNVVDTAAAAANAGTCLEDGNSEDNVFSHIGEAVSQVPV